VLTVIAAEIDVVRIRHLYPRSLLAPPLTNADERVLTDLALATQRRADEVVEVRFVAVNEAHGSLSNSDGAEDVEQAPSDE
jgi:hypothetical protein